MTGCALRERTGFPALPLLALAYVAGVVAGGVLGGPWALSLALAAILAALAGARGERRVWLLAAVVLLCASGHARFAAVDAAPPPALAAVRGEHEVTGVVRDDADVDGTLERADVDVRTLDGAPAAGGIRLTVRSQGEPLRAGDRVRFTADLGPPPALKAFDYVEYLRDRDIYLVASLSAPPAREGQAGLGLRGALISLHRTVVQRIEAALPEPTAALAAGVLVGERGSLPRDAEDALRATGTTHLVVVSGQNIALIMGSAIAMLTAFISRRAAALATGLLLLPAYIVFVGADPPVVRAGLMAIAIVAASAFGRRTPGWTFLAYAAAVMLAYDATLARDVAFQLSAAATAGVVLIAPVIRDTVLAQDALGRWPRLTGPRSAALVGVAATATGAALAVLPVQVAAFERVAPWTVVANVLVAPLYEATAAAAALAALVGGDFGATGDALGAALATAPAAFLWLVRVLAALPGAEVPVRAPVVAGVVFVVALAALTAWLHRRRPAIGGLDPRGLPLPASTLALATIAGALWWTALGPGEGHATVTVLDVGQGLAVLVRDGDRALLIDAGPPDGAVLAALGAEGVRRLDAVVLTHGDLDHRGGLAALTRRLDVGAVYAEGQLAGAVEGALSFDIGDRIEVGRASVVALAPPVATRVGVATSDNDASLVLMLNVGDRRILVAGDVEATGEAWLVQSGQSVRADALVVAHHGSKTSTTPAFLAAVDPAVAVIPVGQNPYGHPHPDVLARLQSLPVYRTDEDGSVTLRSDGELLWVDAAR